MRVFGILVLLILILNFNTSAQEGLGVEPGEEFYYDFFYHYSDSSGDNSEYQLVDQITGNEATIPDGSKLTVFLQSNVQIYLAYYIEILFDETRIVTYNHPYLYETSNRDDLATLTWSTTFFLSNDWDYTFDYAYLTGLEVSQDGDQVIFQYYSFEEYNVITDGRLLLWEEIHDYYDVYDYDTAALLYRSLKIDINPVEDTKDGAHFDLEIIGENYDNGNDDFALRIGLNEPMLVLLPVLILSVYRKRQINDS